MNTLYIEPFSGASGDMFLSALCGLTDSYDLIQSLPEKLNLPDGKVEIQELNKNGIVCKHVKIIDLNEISQNHSHDHSHQHHHGHGHHHHHGEDARHRGRGVSQDLRQHLLVEGHVLRFSLVRYGCTVLILLM